MPSRASVLLIVALMLATALAGCTRPTQPDEGQPIRTGDFVEVAYVLRDGGGELLESTMEADGDEPPELADPSAPGHDPVWWYVFDQEHARSEPGESKQVGVAFRDRFPADGRRDLVVRGFADVADNGSTSNRSGSLWNLPAAVDELDETTVISGLHERLLDAREGEVVELEIPPEEAHGEYDPSIARSFPLVADGQTRQVGPRTLRSYEDRNLANLTENTTEGDVVDYRILADNWVDARVEQINDTHATLFLLVDNGTLLPRDDLWPGRIVDVNATHFSIEQVVEAGETYTLRGREARITETADGTFTLDFNHAYAGKTLRYEIAIQRVVEHDRQRHLRGEQTQPFDGHRLHEVVWTDEFTLLAASGSGVHLVFPPRGPWYGFSQATTDRPATALAVGPDAAGIWVADGDLLASTDGGLSWNATGADLAGIVDLDAPSGDRVLALTDDGTVHASDDGGATWKVLGSAGQTGQGLAVDPDDPDTIYVATDDGLSRSTDGGATWETLAFAGTPVVDVASAGGDRLFAIADGTPMRSTDGGVNWTEAKPDDRNYREIATLPAKDAWVAVGARGGRLGVSQDGGRTWRLVR